MKPKLTTPQQIAAKVNNIDYGLQNKEPKSSLLFVWKEKIKGLWVKICF